jgi:hypothetical protein
MPGIFVSTASKTSIMQKFKAMGIHKRRGSLEAIAKLVNPVVRGIANYYHKFERHSMRRVWNQLQERLLKWVKWEKGLYKHAAVKYLRAKYVATPKLFVHWLLVHP